MLGIIYYLIMLDIGVGVSLEKDPVQAAKEATMFARSNIHKNKFDLAIVFSSTDLSSPNLLKTIFNALNGIPIIGSSGAAIMTNKGISKHGLALMLLSFPDDVHFNIAHIKDVKNKSGLQAGEELGEKLLYGFQSIRRTLGIIFSDTLIEESTDLISGLQAKLGRSFPIVGGSASDYINSSKTYLYFNQEMFNGGCAGLILGGKLNFGLGVKHGWKPLGKPHTVTLSHRNIVLAIDNEPATKLYQDYLGCNLFKLKKELKNISTLYPIGVYVPGEEEYLLRNVLTVEDDGSLSFQGNVPQGSQIRLMISTKETCFQATGQAIDDAQRNSPLTSIEFRKEGSKNFVLVFSSISRYLLLRRDANKELEMIKKRFGENTPIIGLYTYGELAPLMAINYLGQVYFHNQTVTILNIGG